MKRIMKKTYAILLILMLLMNYFTVIVNAVGSFDKEFPYAILTLDSTTKEYKTGDDIFIDIKISEVNQFLISDVSLFKGRVIYDNTVLEFQNFEVVNCIDSGSSLANKIFQVNSHSDSTQKFRLNDTILRIKFKALEAELNTQTTISLIESEVTTNTDVSVLQIDDVVNIPEITLTLNPELKHNLQITKAKENGDAIVNNSALFKITKLDGEVIYKETDENGIITLPELKIPETEAPYIYWVEEILAPAGYIKGENPIQVTVTFDEAGNLTSAVSNENGIASVANENNTIEVKVLNTAKEPEVQKEVFNLVLNKVDEENNSITTDTADFEITMPDGSKASYSTDTTGRTQNIAILAPKTAGTYAYLIKETKAPNGYTAEENNIIVEFTYEKQENKIVLVSGKVVSYNDEAIVISSEEVRTATVNIKNEIELFTYNYTINIDKLGEDNNNIQNNAAVFEISKDDKSEYIVTNSEGKASYNFSMTNKEIVAGQEYTYTLKEIKAPDGYILDETVKTIKLTFNSNGTINTASINESNIEHASNEVNITVINEKEPQIIPPVPEDFELVINKVDEEGNTITAETKYVITLPSGEQVEYSVATGSDKTLPAPEKAGTYVYVLTESTTPEGYIKGEDIVLKLTFEEIDGKIVLVSGDNGVEVTEEEITDEEVIKVATLDVVTKQEIITYNYTINIDKVKNNTFKDNITEDIAIFEITSNGQTTYIKTNPLGKATCEISMTNKEIVANQEYIYTIKEVKAPNGYILDETAKTITITFNSDGTINESTVNGTKIEKINNTTKAVNVRIINEEEVTEPVAPVPEDFKLVINKLDEEGNDITAETKYVVTLPSGEQVEYSVATGSDKTLPAPEKAGTYVYVLTESTTPSGYIKGNDIILKLTFEEIDGKIVLVSGNNGVEVTEEEITDEEVIKVATLDIVTEKQTITYNYVLNIDKINEENQNIESTETMFELTADGQVHYLKTNEEGKVIYQFTKTNKNIVPGQEYVLTLKEIKAPTGYILDETAKTIKLTFNNDGTINTASVNESDIEHASNEVSIEVVNEKEPDVVVPVPQNFELQINKVNENNNLITTGTASFILTKPNGEKSTINTTNGVSSKITLNAPNVAGKQIYFLQETKAPEGYNILSESVIIEANFVESEGKIVLSNVVIKDEEIIPSNNVLTVNIMNEKVKEPETFIVKIAGVDREGNDIQEGTTVVKLTNKETGKYEYKEVAIKDGIIEVEVPKVEGIARYELEQIKAPEGYKINPNPAQIDITFEKDEAGNTQIANYTVTGEDTNKGTSTEENTVSIKITNEKIKVEPEKQNYSIEINKLDSATKDLIEQGSAIFTLVDLKGNIKEYATTNGKIVISGLVPENAGESGTFVIKEKVAPEGYKLTSETIIIKVSFEEVEGKIVVTNPELIMGSSLATVVKTENGNIKIDITNEKEQKEKLYVISRKYKKDTYEFYDEYLGKINETYPIYKEDEDVYQVLDYFYGVIADNGKNKGKVLKPLAYTINRPFIDTKIAKYENGNVLVEEFIGNLESNGHMVVLNQNGIELGPRDLVETGMILRSTLDDQVLRFDIVVKGDGYRAPNEKKVGRVNTGDKNALTNIIAGNTGYITDPLRLRALDIDMDGRLNTSDKAEITELISYIEGGTGVLPYHVKWSNSNILSDKANIQYVKK